VTSLFQAGYFLAHTQLFSGYIHFHVQADACFADHGHRRGLGSGWPTQLRIVEQAFTSFSLARACSTGALSPCRKVFSVALCATTNNGSLRGRRDVHLAAQVAAGVDQLLELGQQRQSRPRQCARVG
jgi:hypothetical protein